MDREKREAEDGKRLVGKFATFFIGWFFDGDPGVECIAGDATLHCPRYLLTGQDTTYLPL
jgi:hypothetical protein